MGDQMTDREHELQKARMDVQLKDSATAGEASASSGGVDIGRLFPEETLQLAFEAARGEATVKVTDEEVASAADELYRLEPNPLVRERTKQVAGTGDREDSTEVWEDYAKMLNGDVNAYVRVLKATGQEPGPNDIYDFRARGGLPLLQVLRAAAIAGDGTVDPKSPLGRRLAENEKDFEKAQRGDREALGRIANQLGLPHSDMQKLLRAVAGGSVAIGSGSSDKGLSGDGSGTGEVTSGAGDPPEAKQARDPWTPPTKEEKGDPSPTGEASGPVEITDDLRKVHVSERSTSGNADEGWYYEKDGKWYDEDGNAVDDETEKALDEKFNKDEKKDDDDDDEMPNPHEDSGPIPELRYGGGYGRPPTTGPDKDPVNPDWGGESDGEGVIVDDEGGVIDPTEDAETFPELRYGGGYGAPPKTGPDKDPVNPEWGGEDGGSGEIDPYGPGGGTDPVAFPTRGGFSRSARFAGRAAVTVGLAAGGFLLGSALADRNGSADANRSDTPAISESDGSTRQNADTAAGRDAGASGPLVEGRGGIPSEQQTRSGAEPAMRLSDDVSSPERGRDVSARVPSEGSPNEGPSRPDGNSSDLDREPDPDLESEAEGGSGPDGGLESGSGDLENQGDG